ncbi:MAG: PAS domain S-box protein, partial [Deltaproteobacteria bacterium]
YKPGHFVASFVEITERKKAEERLRREQYMLARTESIAHVGSWEWEIATDTVTWSDELFRIFMRNPAEGAPSYSEHPRIYHPDDMKELSRVAENAQRDGTPYELELRAIRPNGDIRICFAQGVGERGQDGKITRLFGSLQDITERRQIEAALKKGEERFLGLVKNIPSHIAFVNPNTLQYEFVNGAYEKSFGLLSENIIGHHVKDIIGEANFQFALKYIDEVRGGKTVSYENTFDLISGKRWNEVTYNPIFDFDGNVTSIVVLSYDITERKRAEVALRESEERFRSLMENIPSIAVQGYTLDGTVLFWNVASELLYGYSRDEALGANLLDLIIPPEMREGVTDAIRQMGETGTPIPASELLLQRKDGSRVPVFSSHALVKPFGRPPELFCLDIDLTAQKQTEDEKQALEQQLQQSQKLESLGVLAGGIAHDFNNILAIIMGYCSLTKMDYETAEKNIPEIEKAVERAAALCRQMLAYAGKAPFEKTQVDMCTVVTEMSKMLQSTIAQNVVIKPVLAADVPSILGDASQIRQVVMNLIINAAEAIGDAQGEVRVSLSKKVLNKDGTEKDYLGKIIPHGCYACLEVADTGCGMSDETYNRLFEPFYTTKFYGRGLGMSAMLGIIKTHVGALQLSSELGKGTTFKIYLPVHISDCAGEDPPQQVASVPWQGSGTILLVEDEVQVLQIARTMLESLGFTVIEASNGKEGLELFQKNAGDINLVITDMGMPVMDGYQLFRELKTLKSDLPIIISSGFGDSVVESRIPGEIIAGSISKPYSFNRLRDVLKSVTEGIQNKT